MVVVVNSFGILYELDETAQRVRKDMEESLRWMHTYVGRAAMSAVIFIAVSRNAFSRAEDWRILYIYIYLNPLEGGGLYTQSDYRPRKGIENQDEDRSRSFVGRRPAKVM